MNFNHFHKSIYWIFLSQMSHHFSHYNPKTLCKFFFYYPYCHVVEVAWILCWFCISWLIHSSVSEPYPHLSLLFYLEMQPIYYTLTKKIMINHTNKHKTLQPWPGGSVLWIIIPYTKRLWVQSPVRAHILRLHVRYLVFGGVYGRQLIHVFSLSLSLSLIISLYKNQ